MHFVSISAAFRLIFIRYKLLLICDYQRKSAADSCFSDHPIFSDQCHQRESVVRLVFPIRAHPR